MSEAYRVTTVLLMTALVAGCADDIVELGAFNETTCGVRRP